MTNTNSTTKSEKHSASGRHCCAASQFRRCQMSCNSRKWRADMAYYHFWDDYSGDDLKWLSAIAAADHWHPPPLFDEVLQPPVKFEKNTKPDVSLLIDRLRSEDQISTR